MDNEQKNPPSERLLTEAEQNELTGSIRVGLKVARLETTATPDEVQAQLDGIINDLRQEPPPKDKLVDLSIALGCLWADAVVRQLGWEWAFITKGRIQVYAIVSPDRAFTIFPMVYVRKLVGDPNTNQNSLLLYNLLKAGKLPPRQPGRYLLLG